MRILGIFLNNEIRTGGHVRCLELMEELSQRGNHVSVLLNPALKYKPRHFSEIRVAARYKPRCFPPASMAFKRATSAWLEADRLNEKPDLVLVFGEVHYGAAVKAKRNYDIPLLLGLQSNIVRETLISIRENVFRPHRVVRSLIDLLHYRLYEIRISRSCDAIVFQSQFDRTDFVKRNRGAAGKSHVIGGHIGPPRFTRESCGLNRSISLRKILFMGTMGERKGLRYLLQAFDILWAEGRHQLELHIAGPGTEADRARFQRYVAERGFTEKVTFYGRVPSTFPLMAECDIMVAPSLFDSYPDVVLLGLHVGIPVLGSSVGGIPDMLVHEDLLFPPRDGPAIASILRRCLDEPRRYAELRALSTERRKHFLFDWSAEWENVAAKALAK